MKKITCLLSSALVLLLSSSSFATAEPSQPAISTTVLDQEGDKLQANTNYYIFPVVRGNGGGLALMSRNKTCPFNVAQENHELSHGQPLRFLSSDNKDGVIKLSVDVNIVFDAATICVQQTVWRLGDVDRFTGLRYVTSGGMRGRPGADTMSNWFKIVKNGIDGYKIVYCPSVCSFCNVVCGDVGVYYEGGQRWLGLSDKPFVVMFKKA